MPRIPLLIIALFFLIGGIAHFIVDHLFMRAMPEYLGFHWELVIISGIFELLGAVGILIPKTRLLAAYGLMALCVAVFPANLNMALNPELYPEVPSILLYLRLPLQPLFIWFIWYAVRPERIKKSLQKSTAAVQT